jgi:hypothetical protein
MMYLFDVGVPGGPIGIGLAIGFLFLAGAVAFVAFRLLRKTVKMAFRLAIVAVILMAGFVGTLAFFYIGSGSGKPVPAPSRRR